MKIRPFALERWFAEFEFNVAYNIASSCATPTSTAELLALAGERAREEYLVLPLDYIESLGTEPLKEALSRWYTTIEPANILITTGASEAIFLLMNAVLSAGDKLIVEEPIYQSLHEVARAVGAEVIPWSLREERGYIPDMDELRSLWQPGVKMVVINTPHSPTGTVLPEDVLNEIVRFVAEKEILLVCDEVYRGAYYDPSAATPSAADLTERCVVIGDMTKPFGLGGLRIGWLATRQKGILEACAPLRDYTTMCSAAPSEFLAAIALEHKETLLARKMETARRNMQRFKDFLSDHADLLSWVEPQGGFTAFPRYRVPVPSAEFCRRLVNEQSTLLLPGYTFGREQHFRIGFGRKEEYFAEGLRRFGEYLKKYRKPSAAHRNMP